MNSSFNSSSNHKRKIEKARNFGFELTIREYENALFQIEKLEGTIKDLKIEINHLQTVNQRSENQVRVFCILCL